MTMTMIVFKVRVTKEHEVYMEEDDPGAALKAAVAGEADTTVQKLEAIILGKETEMK